MNVENMPGWQEYDTIVAIKCKIGGGTYYDHNKIIIVGIRVLVIEGKGISGLVDIFGQSKGFMKWPTL